MARKWSGGTDFGTSATLALSAYDVLSVSCWMWWDAFANNDNLMMQLGSQGIPANSHQFEINPNESSTGLFVVYQRLGSNLWSDKFTRPSGAAWHHYAFIFNRGRTVNRVAVDGDEQTLSTVTHTAAACAGTWDNLALMLFGNAPSSLVGAGRMAELAIWGGTSGANDSVGAITMGPLVSTNGGSARALALGASPFEVQPSSNPKLLYYWPFLEDSTTQPDYGGSKASVTLTGTSAAIHPSSRSLIAMRHQGYQATPL